MIKKNLFLFLIPCCILLVLVVLFFVLRIKKNPIVFPVTDGRPTGEDLKKFFLSEPKLGAKLINFLPYKAPVDTIVGLLPNDMIAFSLSKSDYASNSILLANTQFGIGLQGEKFVLLDNPAATTAASSPYYYSTTMDNFVHIVIVNKNKQMKIYTNAKLVKSFSLNSTFDLKSIKIKNANMLDIMQFTNSGINNTDLTKIMTAQAVLTTKPDEVILDGNDNVDVTEPAVVLIPSFDEIVAVQPDKMEIPNLQIITGWLSKFANFSATPTSLYFDVLKTNMSFKIDNYPNCFSFSCKTADLFSVQQEQYKMIKFGDLYFEFNQTGKNTGYLNFGDIPCAKLKFDSKRIYSNFVVFVMANDWQTIYFNGEMIILKNCTDKNNKKFILNKDQLINVTFESKNVVNLTICKFYGEFHKIEYVARVLEMLQTKLTTWQIYN